MSPSDCSPKLAKCEEIDHHFGLKAYTLHNVADVQHRGHEDLHNLYYLYYKYYHTNTKVKLGGTVSIQQNQDNKALFIRTEILILIPNYLPVYARIKNIKNVTRYRDSRSVKSIETR